MIVCSFEVAYVENAKVADIAPNDQIRDDCRDAQYGHSAKHSATGNSSRAIHSCAELLVNRCKNLKIQESKNRYRFVHKLAFCP